MAAKRIMIQGTGSHVGKSVLATALCRIFAQDGFRVAPFKSQNMALNSYVTALGGEMGRSQVAQAEAARIEPHVDMNPILLKPTSDMGSQVIVRGKAIGTMKWREYSKLKEQLLGEALAAYSRLAEAVDIVVIEGAGSPAEVNLRSGDIVNMRIARETGAPVYLVADIDRGGALAWVVGTIELLEPEERAQVKGILFNKFRGDVEILRPGLRFLEDRLGIPVVGVIPYVRNVGIAEEDSVALEQRAPEREAREAHGKGRTLDVAVLQPSRISNFTDVDALARSPGVRVRFVRPGERLRVPDLVVLPGSKNTVDDLCELQESGLSRELHRFAESGGCVVGICGGYQMLGTHVADPYRTESERGGADGIGLLPVSTTLHPDKVTTQVRGVATTPFAAALPVVGYEIHTGRTVRQGGEPWLSIRRRTAVEGEAVDVDDGCVRLEAGPSGMAVFGTYVHGIFDAAEFRGAFLDWMRVRRGLAPLGPVEEFAPDPYDVLADAVRPHLDLDRMYEAMGIKGPDARDAP